MLDGTILRCGPDCRCGGQHKKVAMINGTALEVVGRFSGHETHRGGLTIHEWARMLGGTVVYATSTV